MNTLYGRVAKLIVGIPGQEGLVINSFVRDEKTNTLKDGIRFKFKIEKTATQQPNKASIEIYNLTKEHSAAFEKKGVTVLLEAGYGNIIDSSVLIGGIFKGDALKTYTKKEKGDLITVIETGDGFSAYSNSNIDVSYGEGTKSSGIIDTLISGMGLAKGDTSGVDENDDHLNGFTASGMSRDVLTDLTDKMDSEWSIQDGAVQIIKKKGFTKKEAIVLATAFGENKVNTGLIGSPTRSGFQGSKDKQGSGIECVALLQPGLNPGQRVMIQSLKVNGTFVIKKATYEGDTQGGQWVAKLECAPV